MIKKDDCFVWSINLLNEIDKKTVGKWIVWGSKSYMNSIFPKIDEMVLKGEIYRAKYAHRENKEIDPSWNKEPVMCIYADDNTKDKTLNLLRELNIKPVSWKYDEQTRQDWKPGGRLSNQAESNKKWNSR